MKIESKDLIIGALFNLNMSPQKLHRVRKHYPSGQDHDQQKHGDWTTGFTEAERAGIERMSTRGPTLEQIRQSAPVGRGPSFQQAKQFVFNDPAIYETYEDVVEDKVRIDNPDFEDAEVKAETKRLIEADILLPGFIDEYEIAEEYRGRQYEGQPLSTQEMTELFQEVYGIDIVTKKGVEISTQVVEARALVGSNSIVIEGVAEAHLPENDTTKKVGDFRRIISVDQDGVVYVEHQSLVIDTEYQGLGIGKKFINQSEDWYTARGIDQVSLGTSWDGAYTWSKAGYDFDPDSAGEAVSEIAAKVRFFANTNKLTKGEVGVWEKLLQRSTNNFQTKQTGDGKLLFEYDDKDITEEDFPVPAEFAAAPKARSIMKDLQIGMTKYLTPEGRNLASGPIDRDGDGMVFDGTPRERPAKPSERVAAAKWNARDKKLQAISNAYYQYGKDDFTNESEGSNADNPKLDEAIDRILSKGDLTKHFPGGQDHDQTKHGDWAPGSGQPTHDPANNLTQDEINDITTETILRMPEQDVNDLNESAMYYVTTDGYNVINTYLRKGGSVVTKPELLSWAEQDDEIIDAATDWYDETIEDLEPDEIESEGLSDLSTKEIVARYLDSGESGDVERDYMEDVVMDGHVRNLDNAIAKAPDGFGKKNLFRTISSKVLSNLNPGDVLEDKGFTSTTYTDITLKENLGEKERLMDIGGGLGASSKIAAVILPSVKGDGKGLLLGVYSSMYGENEVLLPRNSRFEFLGFQRTKGDPMATLDSNRELTAVFRRLT